MPTIVVEDGSQVAGANSYVSLAEARAYAVDRGYSLSTDDDVLGQQLILATGYLESRSYVGSKVDASQSLQWPRSSAKVDGFAIEEIVIPSILKEAQHWLVIEQSKGLPLYPTPNTSTTEGLVIAKKLGPLEKKYSGNSSRDGVLANPNQAIRFASVEVLLKRLAGCGSQLPVDRG